MAKQVGVSRMSVNRIWREHKLKPHQVKGFKVSNDPLFAEKLREVARCDWSLLSRPCKIHPAANIDLACRVFTSTVRSSLLIELTS
ncbi:hypothetical protein SAMN05421754_101772 [Nitrosomonas sp. Nm58]|nr:hypothetical protein SAMN05421754_101772 [Nitrosomonas sp. Nm58]